MTQVEREGMRRYDEFVKVTKEATGKELLIKFEDCTQHGSLFV